MRPADFLGMVNERAAARSGTLSEFPHKIRKYTYGSRGLYHYQPLQPSSHFHGGKELGHFRGCGNRLYICRTLLHCRSCPVTQRSRPKVTSCSRLIRSCGRTPFSAQFPAFNSSLPSHLRTSRRDMSCRPPRGRMSILSEMDKAEPSQGPHTQLRQKPSPRQPPRRLHQA